MHCTSRTRVRLFSFALFGRSVNQVILADDHVSLVLKASVAFPQSPAPQLGEKLVPAGGGQRAAETSSLAVIRTTRIDLRHFSLLRNLEGRGTSGGPTRTRIPTQPMTLCQSSQRATSRVSTSLPFSFGQRWMKSPAPWSELLEDGEEKESKVHVRDD